MNKVTGLYAMEEHVGHFLQVLFANREDAEAALESINEWIKQRPEIPYAYYRDDLTEERHDALDEKHRLNFPIKNCATSGDSYFIQEMNVVEDDNKKPRCSYRKCAMHGEIMSFGQYIAPILRGRGDFHEGDVVVTVSAGGAGELAGCWKCEGCGESRL